MVVLYERLGFRVIETILHKDYRDTSVHLMRFDL